ncbi:hypothetical protein [Micromonospora aurantiaca (nom. illeg.)]
MVDGGDAARWLHLNAARGGPDDLSLLVNRVASAIGATDIVIYLADYTQSSLVPLVGAGAPRDELTIETTLAGRAFTGLQVQRAPDRPDRLWVPLLLGWGRWRSCRPAPAIPRWTGRPGRWRSPSLRSW